MMDDPGRWRLLRLRVPRRSGSPPAPRLRAFVLVRCEWPPLLPPTTILMKLRPAQKWAPLSQASQRRAHQFRHRRDSKCNCSSSRTLVSFLIIIMAAYFLLLLLLFRQPASNDSCPLGTWPAHRHANNNSGGCGELPLASIFSASIY